MLTLYMPEGQSHWLWCVDEQPWQSAPSIDALIQQVNSDKIKSAVVYFPSTLAQFVSVPIEQRQFKKLGAQGAKYLIEEHISEPIEHLAIFSQFRAGSVYFMALAKSSQEMMQQSLSLLPWKISALLPDFLLVPEPPADTLYVRQVLDRTLIRWSALQGYVLEDVQLLGLIPAHIEQIQGFDTDSELLERIAQQLGGVAVSQASDEPKIPVLLRHPFNALGKQQHSQQISGYWKASAALLCAAILAQALFDTLHWVQYKKQANATATLALEQYKSWFPNETRVTEKNLRTQFKAKLLQNASADREALQLISQVGALVQQANMVVSTLSYQEHQLQLNLRAQNSERFSYLVEQLKQQGLQAQLGEMNSQNGQVLGQVKIQ